jgi:NAD(P)H-nitrite reductase large subunit
MPLPVNISATFVAISVSSINLILNNSVRAIEGSKKVTKVILQKGTLECDMVVVSIGVAPNTTIVKNSGITINHGIIVDSTMQTNLKNIYAAGDIAEVREQITGKQGSYAIWPNAIEQGRIAGLNMVNQHATYHGAEVVNVLDVFNIPIVAMGLTSSDILNGEVISRFTPNSSKKLLIQNNRIVGLQYIGSLRNVGTFYGLMKKGTDIHSVKRRLLDDNFVIAPDIVPNKL